MRTLAGWCVRHRRLVVLLWAAVLIASLLMVKAAGTAYSNDFKFPHTQSFDAINLLKSVAPGRSGDTEQVVFGTSGDNRLTDPAIGARINKMVDEIKALPNVSVVVSPYDSAGNLVNTANINADHTVGFLQVNFDKQPNKISPSQARWPRTRTTNPSAAPGSASCSP
jgi:RND superfamily putative drug exporter